MSHLWIVVADVEAARIYRKIADRPGLTFIRQVESGAGDGSAELIRDVCALLEFCAGCGEFDQLVLTASSQLLHRFHQQIGPGARQRLIGSLPAELMDRGPGELDAYVAGAAITN